MANRTDKNNSTMAPWHVEILRASAFPSPDAQFDSTKWWESVVGSAPDTHIDNVKIGAKETRGALNEVLVGLNVQAVRIDWTFTPNPQAADATSSLLTLGSFEEYCARFYELVQKWLPLSPPLSRLAFGTIVYLLADSKEDSYRKLQGYLPSVTLDTMSSDFIYRINRPRKSKSEIPGLTINRLSTWMAIRVELHLLAPGAPGGLKGVVAGKPVDACRVELDINTAQNYEGLFKPEQSAKVFTELRDTANEILGGGDRP